MLTTWKLHFTGITAEDSTLLLIGKGRKTRIWILILPTAIIPQGALPQSLRTCSPFTFITAGTGSNSSGELIWVLHSFLFPSVGCLEDVLAGVINSEALSPDSESVSTSCLPVMSCTVSTVRTVSTASTVSTVSTVSTASTVSTVSAVSTASTVKTVSAVSTVSTVSANALWRQLILGFQCRWRSKVIFTKFLPFLEPEDIRFFSPFLKVAFLFNPTGSGVWKWSVSSVASDILVAIRLVLDLKRLVKAS